MISDIIHQLATAAPRGSRKCKCGKVISSNKRLCRDCADTKMPAQSINALINQIAYDPLPR